MSLGGLLRRDLRMLPLGLAAALAWVSVLTDASLEWWEYGIATALLVPAQLARIWVERAPDRRPAALPTLIFLAGLGMLRDSAGGSPSGVSIVALVPVFYIALETEGRRELGWVLLALAVFYLAPILIVGGPGYPASQYRVALLTLSTASIVGFATKALVARARREAREASRRGEMLEQVAELVSDLYMSADVRQDVCEAARRISDAHVAGLLEPMPGGTTLRSTASAGFEANGAHVAEEDRPNAALEAFRTGRRIMVSEDLERHVGSREIWEASGCPECVLYEPLTRDSETIGVLVVGWPRAVRAEGPRATVIALLAHEASRVIPRRDLVNELVDHASNDPLTGLPNRRTWDMQIAHASSSGRPFTIAVLDLDHFKEYNDTHGHPAGDRLLKETASRWRDELRSGDLLARIGGEEFGLLLAGADPLGARDVIERLRGSVYGERTCSAGFAALEPGESAAEAFARADEALYEAKAAGRDRACAAATVAG